MVTMDQKLIACVVVVVLVIGVGMGIGIGVIIGRTSADIENPETREADEAMSDRIMNEINVHNIRENLKILTAKPHVAGTENDLSGAQFIGKTWQDQGLDTVKIIPYKVLLQHPPGPNSLDRNKVEIFNPSDPSNPLFVSASEEDPLGEDELEQDGIPPPYMAYSATGDIQGDVVYVHYCRIKDLSYINDTLGVDLKGKIFIARMSIIPRFEKVQNAENFGAAGLILYPDPDDYSKGKVFPNGTFLPSSGAPRGSILKEAGDPLTPGYPAKDYTYRLNVSEVKLPRILVHPIGYGDAGQILSKMKGKEDRWGSVGLNITYKIGPGFAAPYENYRMRMVINSKSSQMWTYNAMGYLKGELEPDRYIIIGNHRDAWGLGSVDPTSGTACLLELSRVFGKLKKDGWRPRRTIIFGSWGAEEFALIGSVEYTEEFYMNLFERAVAYLNLDIAVTGDYVLSASGSPHLANVIFEAAKKVADPRPSDDRKTLYDTMRIRKSENSSDPNSLPELPMVSGGTDYHGFIYGVGVSCISAYYLYNFDEHWRSFYPLYHTSYETFRLMDEIIDPDFKTHLAVAQIFGEMLRRLSDEYVLPMDVVHYAETIQHEFDDFLALNISRDLVNHGPAIDYLQGAIKNFSYAAANFSKSLANVNKHKALNIRKVNDQMMLLERAFMDREGLPRQNEKENIQRHVLFAPTTPTFPGLHIAIDTDDEEERRKLLEKQFSVLTYSIQSAATTLMDVVSW